LKNNDLLESIRCSEVWIYLAWQDIKLRYRGSILGPLWITISMALFILSLGIVYSRLFNTKMIEYLPFLSIGFVFWDLFSVMLKEFPNVYVNSASYIKDIKANLLTMFFRVIARHIIIFAHNVLIVIGIYLYFGINPGLSSMLVIPGFTLVLMNLIAIGISISILGARFRDLNPIMQSFTQVLFFVTPITWFPRLIPINSWIMLVNPFVYYIDLTRSPLLGQLPTTQSWIASLISLLFFSFIATCMYKTKANRISLWV
jgi:ABC-type polysaccharide/polyol phosphate export permease